MNYYKFSSTATENTPDILQGKTEVEFLKSKYQKGFAFGLDNLHKYGCYKISGWAFDFRDVLRKFVVKQYDNWQEYYAPNKTMLRQSLYGNIQKIVEIK
jgi:hypothetical protein